MILGFDISTHQGQVDFAVAQSREIRFNICRAGYPSKYFKFYNKDLQYDRNSELSPNYFPTTAYHLFRPQWDGAWQADKFCELIYNKNFFKRPAVDVELNEFFASKSSFQTQLLKFLNRMDANGYPDVMIYTRGSFWNVNVWDATKKTPQWASNYNLWVARYGVDKPWINLDDIYRPNPWTTYIIHQYSADGNLLGSYYGAESLSIDLNYFNGTEQQFSEFIDIPYVPPQDEEMRYKVIVNKLNVRELPDKTSTDKGDLLIGDVVGVFETKKDNLGNDWARLGLNQYSAINEKVNGVIEPYMSLTTDPINKINL